MGVVVVLALPEDSFGGLHLLVGGLDTEDPAEPDWEAEEEEEQAVEDQHGDKGEEVEGSSTVVAQQRIVIGLPNAAKVKMIL